MLRPLFVLLHDFVHFQQSSLYNAFIAIGIQNGYVSSR